jgi:hypothetical protein
MQTIGELIKLPQKVKHTSERAECIKFFLEKITDKQGKQYKPARMAVLLSHIKTSDLFYSISIFRDTERRRGREAAQKEFWYKLRV